MPLDQTGYRNTFPLTKVLDRLFLGGFKDAEDLRSGNPHNITHICNCTTEQLTLPSQMRHQHHPDGPARRPRLGCPEALLGRRLDPPRTAWRWHRPGPLPRRHQPVSGPGGRPISTPAASTSTARSTASRPSARSCSLHLSSWSVPSEPLVSPRLPSTLQADEPVSKKGTNA